MSARESRQSDGRTLAVTSMLVVLLLNSPAYAAKSSAPPTPSPPTKWAIHPLVVVGGDPKEVRQYVAAFESALAKSGIDRANPKLVSAFLAQEGGCVRRDDCLAKLAKAVNSERTLLVTLSPFSKEMILTIKVVGADGKVLNESASTVNRGPDEKSLDAARDAFEILIGDLQTEPAPLAPLTPAEPPKREAPVVVQTPAPDQTGSSAQPKPSTKPSPVATASAPATPGTWKTPVGIGLAAAGAASIGVGTLFLVQAGQTWNQMKPFYQDDKLPTLDDKPRLLEIKRRAEGQQTVSTIAFVAGAVALGAGGFFYFNDTRTPASQVSMGLSVAPSSATFVMRFP